MSTIDQIRSDVNYLVNTSISNYPDADLIRNVNRHYDNVVSLIMQSDGRWKWDDTNNTSQPATSITMTGGINQVAIPDTTYLTINRVEVLNNNGNYSVLKPIHEKEIGQALSEFQKTDGTPLYYEKVGGFLNLYPAPSSSNVVLTSGLKVYYQRDASYFVVSDATKVPGFATPYHRLLSYGAALDYAIANGMSNKINIITPLIQKMEQELMTFYSSRSKDENVRFTITKEDYGQENCYGISDKQI